MENYDNTANTNITKYTDEIAKYLGSKLPDLPIHTLLEISTYIGCKTCVLVNDSIAENNRTWQREWNRAMRSFKVSRLKHKTE